MIQKTKIYKKFADLLRVLSVEMVDNAGSGHQGVCLGFADVMSVLWNRFYSHQNDRFVLSNGHGSAMLYASIYLSGNENLTIEDLKNFRKLGSKTQGHPERNPEIGIHITTGALGQGLASAVGLAIALKKKQQNGKVYVSVGDGDLMEGISHEAMTLAASLNLDNLIVLFDDNDICIDGKSSQFTTNNVARFEAYGFTTMISDGHDYQEIESSLEKAQNSEKPVVISFKTIIGKFSNMEGSNKCHGKFLKPEDIKEMRKSFGLPSEKFSIPSDFTRRSYKLNLRQPNDYDISESIQKLKKEYINAPSRKATRALFGEIINRIQNETENNIIGGSADLSESTCAISRNSVAISSNNFDGNYIHYGIREHAMGAIMNGLSAEGFIPFGATFLVFSDYMRPAIRNAALMNLGVIFVFTHDSIAVGEDGATHQPIEQLASLRAIPNVKVFRPACDIEVIECIELAIQNRNSPSIMVLSRQPVEPCVKTYNHENMCSNGMYEIYKNYELNDKKTTTIIATGSEVSIAIEKSQKMENSRVISAPCLEIFKDIKILGSGRKIIIEAGSPQPWYKYISQGDEIFSVNTFGESGQDFELIEKFLKKT